MDRRLVALSGAVDAEQQLARPLADRGGGEGRHRRDLRLDAVDLGQVVLEELPDVVKVGDAPEIGEAEEAGDQVDVMSDVGHGLMVRGKDGGAKALRFRRRRARCRRGSPR